MTWGLIIVSASRGGKVASVAIAGGLGGHTSYFESDKSELAGKYGVIRHDSLDGAAD